MYLDKTVFLGHLQITFHWYWKSNLNTERQKLIYEFIGLKDMTDSNCLCSEDLSVPMANWVQCDVITFLVIALCFRNYHKNEKCVVKCSVKGTGISFALSSTSLTLGSWQVINSMSWKQHIYKSYFEVWTHTFNMCRQNTQSSLCAAFIWRQYKVSTPQNSDIKWTPL